MMLTSARAVAATAVILSLLAACAPAAPATSALPCIEPSSDFAAELARGVTPKSTTLRGVFAVESPEHQRTWYVAGHADEPGGRIENTALWATNIMPQLSAPSGTVVAVNGTARRISSWGRDRTDLAGAFSESDVGARAAIECVSRAMGR